MSENTKEKTTYSENAVISSFCCRYVIGLILATVMAVITYVTGYSSKQFLIETVTASCLVYVSMLIQNIYLNKQGFSRKKRIEGKKHLESRLMGSLDDISGIGTMMGAISGVASAFADIYVINGGIFSGDELMLPLTAACSKALTIGCCIAMITSSESMQCLFYITCCRCFEKKNAQKDIRHVSRYKELTKAISAACSVRITAVISLAVIIMVVSILGTGSPYSSLSISLIYLTCVFVTVYIPKADVSEKSEKKTPLWDKLNLSFCITNILSFAVIVFALLYTFPFKSVYCSDAYQTIFKFEYDMEISESIEVLSIPEINTDNMGLFVSLFAVTIEMLIVSSVFSNVRSFDFISEASKKERLVAVFEAFSLIVAYVLITGFIIPEAVFDFVEWLVIISILCLMISVNLIYRLVVGNRAASVTTKNKD